MTQPTGYPFPPGQIPSGHGYPQPPKKIDTTLRVLAAIFGLALIVLAGIGVKTTFFDKKGEEARTSDASTTSRSVAPSPGRAAAPTVPSAVPLPAPEPSSAPAPADNGYVPAEPTPVAVQKYLHSVHLDQEFASIPDQKLVDVGLQGCVYLSTATGATPLSNGEGFAAQIGVPRTQAMEILGAATGAFCREFIDRMTR